jgi:hypothetical protein
MQFYSATAPQANFFNNIVKVRQFIIVPGRAAGKISVKNGINSVGRPVLKNKKAAGLSRKAEK